MKQNISYGRLRFEHRSPLQHSDICDDPRLPKGGLPVNVGTFLMHHSNASQRTIPLPKDRVLTHGDTEFTQKSSLVDVCLIKPLKGTPIDRLC